jgi:hypothetical protein
MEKFNHSILDLLVVMAIDSHTSVPIANGEGEWFLPYSKITRQNRRLVAMLLADGLADEHRDGYIPNPMAFPHKTTTKTMMRTVTAYYEQYVGSSYAGSLAEQVITAIRQNTERAHWIDPGEPMVLQNGNVPAKYFGVWF